MTATAVPTTPFSLKMTEVRDGAYGLGIIHALTELIDDSFDARDRNFSFALVPTPTTQFLVALDTGDGMEDPHVLYGIGPSVIRKSADCRGLKNTGFRAAIGRLSPDLVTTATRTRGNRARTLSLDLARLYGAIDVANRAGHCNYSEIDTHHLSSVLRVSPAGAGLTDETREIVSAVLDNMRASGRDFGDMTNTLQRIYDNREPSYCLHILSFSSFPADFESQITDAVRSYCLTYNDLLRAGHSINFYGPSATFHCTAANAEDPLGPPEFPRITFELEFRVPDATDRTDYKVATHLVKLTATDGHTTATFGGMWAPDVPVFRDGKARSPFVRDALPDGWETAVPKAAFTMQFSAPSEAAMDQQIARIRSSHCSSREHQRGVRTIFNGRDLGKPVWGSRWGADRNAGGICSTLRCNDPFAMETYCGIQTRKHMSTFENFHPVLQMVLNWLVSNIVIKKRTNYKVCSVSTGILDWRFETLCCQIANQKAKDAVPTHSSDPTATDSDAESESSGSASAAALTEEVSTIVHKSAPAPAPAPIPVVAHTRTAPAAGPTPKETAQNLLVLKDLLNEIPPETIAEMLTDTSPDRNLKVLALSIGAAITAVGLCKKFHHT